MRRLISSLSSVSDFLLMIDPITLPVDEMEHFECISMNPLQLARFLTDFQIATEFFRRLQNGGNPQVGEFGGIYYNYRITVARRAR